MAAIDPFDPLSKNFHDNPYSEFKRMRESCRAYRHEGTLMPVVSFFHNSDIRKMLSDWESWSSERDPEYNKKALGDAAMLIGNDPPLHTQYRDIVAPIFLPRDVAPLAPLIEELTAENLDRVVGAGEINFVEDLAADITVATICAIAGVPKEDRALMRKMTIDLAIEDGRPVFWKEPNPETETRVARTFQEMGTYFAEHFANRDPYKHDDILSKDARHIDEPRVLVGLCTLIVAAVNETTTNLISHGPL